MEENTNTTTDVVDNSDVEYSDADILSALDDTSEPSEPPVEDTPKDDNNGGEPHEENKDNTQTEYPDKFKKEDGSVDIERMYKSYSELEAYKTKLEQERADLNKYKEQVEQMQQQREEEARNAGFNSVEDMQHMYQVAAFEANEYAKYLAYTDDPEAVRQMLINYQNNPSDALMEDIEMEFSPDINKKVASASARAQAQYEAQLAQQAETGKLANIENIIGQTVDANSDVFNYEPFKKMFVGLLQKYGDAIQPEDAIMLANTMTEMKDLYRQEFEKMTGTTLANSDATDKLATLSDNKTAPAASQPVNWETLSEKELAKYIAKYI